MAMVRWITRLLVVLVVAVFGASTTTASTATLTYDVPAIVRVGVHAIGTGEASPTQLIEVREGSASPPAEARAHLRRPSLEVLPQKRGQLGLVDG